MIGLDHYIKKRVDICAKYMGKGVRKHFAVLDTILQQFIVYDIISIANLSSFHHIIQLTNIFYGPRRF